jgi:diacylglycerol kinase family enzyme
MTDAKDQDSKSTEETEVPHKEFAITIPSFDGSIEVTAHLQENTQDATHPPSLLNLSSRPLSPPAPAVTPHKTHIILSTGSGHQKAEIFFNDVVTPIFNLIHTGGIENTTIHTTQSASTILDLTRDIFLPSANRGHPLRLILLSGDGGIVDLVNGLLALPHGESYISPSLTLLPLGTANALYHSIHTRGGSNTWGLHALSSPSAVPLPTFTATFSPGARLLVDEARTELAVQGGELHGAVVFSWGMHASLVADSDSAEYRKFGIERFQRAAKEALFPTDGAGPHTYRGKLATLGSGYGSGSEGEWKETDANEHLYVLATMVSHLEAPFCISPASKPLDGSLRLVYFGPVAGDEAMRLMGLAYQGGKHVDEEKVRYEAVEGVRVRFEEEEARWRRVCVDGKIVRVEEGGWVEVRKGVHKAINVVR